MGRLTRPELAAHRSLQNTDNRDDFKEKEHSVTEHGFVNEPQSSRRQMQAPGYECRDSSHLMISSFIGSFGGVIIHRSGNRAPTQAHSNRHPHVRINNIHFLDGSR